MRGVDTVSAGFTACYIGIFRHGIGTVPYRTDTMEGPCGYCGFCGWWRGSSPKIDFRCRTEFVTHDSTLAGSRRDCLPKSCRGFRYTLAPFWTAALSGLVIDLFWLGPSSLRLEKRPLIMPTVSVDKAALFKELGREYVLGSGLKLCSSLLTSLS